MTAKRDAILNKIESLLVAAKSTIGYKSIKVADINPSKKYPNIAIYWIDSEKQTDILGDSTGFNDEWEFIVNIDIKVHDYSRQERLSRTDEMLETIENILKARENRRLSGLCDLMDYQKATPGQVFTGNKLIKLIKLRIRISGM